jgi:hypothetical protein
MLIIWNDRARRVKCDETRPTCLRCARWPIQCRGYECAVREPLAIRPQLPLRPIPSRNLRSTPLFLCPLPSKRLFQDDRAGSFFKHFCQETAPKLAGYFDSDIWCRLVLQGCEQDYSARHTAVAIAALDIHNRAVVQLRPSKRSITDGIADSSRQFAFQQYGHAISNMRLSVAKTPPDLRTILVLSILIIQFEQIVGNLPAMFSQIQVVQKLLKQMGRRGTHSLSSNQDSAEDELKTFFMIQRSAGSITKSHTPDWKQPFKNTGQPRVYEEKSWGIITPLSKLPLLPLKFNSLTEARNHLGLYVTLTIFHGPAFPNYTRDDVTSCWKSSLLDGFSRWNAAYQDVSMRAKTSNIENDVLGEKSLRAQYLAALLTLRLFNSELCPATTNRDLVPMWEELIHAGTDVIEHSMQNGQTDLPVIEGQVIMPLAIAGWRCPDRMLRRKAICALLVSPGRREGFWDASSVAVVNEWLLAVEEEGLEDDTGYISEDAKVSDIVMELEPAAGRIIVSCLKPSKDIPGGVRKQATLKWEIGNENVVSSRRELQVAAIARHGWWHQWHETRL